MAITGKQIRKLRESLGASQADFAKKVGVTQKCVSFWEQGTTHPKYPQLVKILELTGQKIVLVPA